MNNYYVISAAGGNTTAFKVIKNPLTRSEYVEVGKELMERFVKYNIEQTATAIISNDSMPHCEMSGGEFCGNAARAMAVLLHNHNTEHTNEFVFTMSGIEKPIKGSIQKISDNKFVSTCEFFDLPIKTYFTYTDGIKLTVVDLGGIVHVICNGELPIDYKLIHKQIVNSLNLEKRDAVGVIWMTETAEKGIAISPIVWVREIDTLFFESSCGSGSIAAAIASGQERVGITQPTGMSISVTINHQQVVLVSEMEVMCNEQCN